MDEKEKFVCCQCGVDLHVPFKTLDEGHLCEPCTVKVNN
jgi:hypothetical protein